MASEYSSAEENLPLSQKTYSYLFNQLKMENDLSSFLEDVNEQELNHQDLYPSQVQSYPQFSNLYTPEVQMQPSLQQGLSSLPASENWPGPYEFKMSFQNLEIEKGASYVFSDLLNRHYVRKGAPIAINFSTNTSMPNNVYIRAMALFSEPKHVLDKVHRCLNHSMYEMKEGKYEAEHLIRCESSSSSYETDPQSGRHSVIVPYENPPVGQSFSTYIYKFMCYSSCNGGPNRRNIMLVFTLEENKQVIGRCKVDIKICAAPGRDKKIDEKKLQPTESAPKPILSKKHKISIDIDTDLIPTKKSKPFPEENVGYTIWVQDKECYHFLKGAKKYYYLLAEMQKFRFSFVCSTSEEET